MRKFLVVVFVCMFFVSGFSVKITMAMGTTGKVMEVLYEQLELFSKEYPDIQVEVMHLPESSTTQHDLLATYLASGNPDPVIFSIDCIWPAEFEPFLVDLSNDYEYFEFEDFFEGSSRSVKVGDKIVGVPWVIDAGMLYYRKDLLDKYGYDVPETWDELYQTAKDISSKEGIHGFVWQGARYEGLVCDVFEFVRSFGGELIDGEKVVVDDPQYFNKNVAAITFMKKLIDDGISPRGVITHMEEEARRIFQNGEAVFMRNWSYAWILANDENSPVQGKIGVTTIPKGPEPDGRSSSTLGGWSLAINGNASDEQIDAAKKLIRFLTSKEQQVYKSINDGTTPARKSAYLDPRTLEVFPFFEEMYEVYLAAEPRPVSPIYTEISYEIQVAVHQVLASNKNPEVALKELSNNLRNLMSY